MPTLVLYIPFSRPNAHATDVGDLRENEREFSSASPNCQIDNTNITQSISIYLGEENNVNIGHGDYVIVNAHGALGTNTKLYDNINENITMNNVIAGLNTMNAGNANAIAFHVCFSALPNHIASTWKHNHVGQKVLGRNDTVQGPVVKVVGGRKNNPGRIWKTIFDGGQLVEL